MSRDLVPPNSPLAAGVLKLASAGSLRQMWMDERGDSPALARSFERSSGAGRQVGTMDGPGGMVVMFAVQDIVGDGEEVMFTPITWFTSLDAVRSFAETITNRPSSRDPPGRGLDVDLRPLGT